MTTRKINIGYLKQCAREQLEHLLEYLSPHRSKDLIIQHELLKPLDKIAGVQLLKSSGVDKIYRFYPGPLASCSNLCRVYMLTTNIKSIQYACDQINNSIQNEIGDVEYHLIIVPRGNEFIKRILEEEGLAGIVHLHNFEITYFPFDEDRISMEVLDLFGNVYIDGNLLDLSNVAFALFKWQSTFGHITKVIGHGAHSSRVVGMLNKMKVHMSDGESSPVSPVDCLYIFDRDIDYPSVLLSQLTYEGLLDEVFSLRLGVLEVSEPRPIKLEVNSQCEIYKDICDSHFTKVASYLRAKVSQFHSRRQQLQTMSLQQMKNLIQKDLKELQKQHSTVSLHIDLCEIITKTKGDHFHDQLCCERNILEGSDPKTVIAFLEDSIASQSPWQCVLRLICLMSCVNGGLNPKDYNNLKRLFLHSYGYQHLVTFHHLKKAGLLVVQDSAKMSNVFSSKSTFQTLAKKLDLIPSEDHNDHNLKNPTDTSYVFGGSYSPLIPNLIKKVLKTGDLSSVEECLKLIPGPTINCCHGNPCSKGGAILVCIIGGVTYSEMAALRLLGFKMGIEVYNLATSVINGESLMNKFAEVITI